MDIHYSSLYFQFLVCESTLPAPRHLSLELTVCRMAAGAVRPIIDTYLTGILSCSSDVGRRDVVLYYAMQGAAWWLCLLLQAWLAGAWW